jgi:hypothetical protein
MQAASAAQIANRFAAGVDRQRRIRLAIRFAAKVMPAALAAPSPACIDKPPATPKDAARKNRLENSFGESDGKKTSPASRCRP